MEITLLRDTLEERDRDHLLTQRDLRKQIVDAQEAMREKLIQRNGESEELLKSYHEKKVRSANWSWDLINFI